MIGTVAYLPALIIAAAALLALLVMIRVLLGSVRRFRTELAEYRARLDGKASVLQAGHEELRGWLDGARGRTEARSPQRVLRVLSPGETEERYG
jgi:hypothetical protein